MGAATSEKERDQRALARVGRTVCGKWHLDQLLGVGGIAAVYAATHRNGKRVAIKVLHAEHAHLDEVRERFLEEGYVANRVGHPAVASVLDDGVMDDGAIFLVMDLLEGETLDQRFQRYGQPLSVEEVLSVADQVLDVLIAAHDAGIVHRDIKPENIFATHSGEIKLLDFGIARLEQPRRSRTTEVGFTMGTPAFMPPEQARGRTNLISGRSDIWALGATMFWLLSGRFVREAETLNEELLQAMTRSAPSLRTLPDIPDPVAELVDCALQFDVENRWEDARSMQARVREVYACITGADHAHTVPPEVARGKADVPFSGWRKRQSPFDHPSSDGHHSLSYRSPATATPTTHPPVATSAWPGPQGPKRRATLAVLGLILVATIGFVAVRSLSGPAPSRDGAASAVVSAEAAAPPVAATPHPERLSADSERSAFETNSRAGAREAPETAERPSASDPPSPSRAGNRPTRRSSPPTTSSKTTEAPPQPEGAPQDDDPLSRRK